MKHMAYVRERGHGGHVARDKSTRRNATAGVGCRAPYMVYLLISVVNVVGEILDAGKDAEVKSELLPCIRVIGVKTRFLKETACFGSVDFQDAFAEVGDFVGVVGFGGIRVSIVETDLAASNFVNVHCFCTRVVSSD